MGEIYSRELAEVVGLWLAEGDSKTKREITFTNSEQYLIKHFHEIIVAFLKIKGRKISLYVYSNEGFTDSIPIIVKNLRQYEDKRASRPYFIWRYASVEMVKFWKKIVKNILAQKNLMPFVVRGFFAGEGNIKNGQKGQRVIRIAQGKRVYWLEQFFKDNSIHFNYAFKNRAYEVWGRNQWDFFHKNNLCTLHPLKKKQFDQVYFSFKQYHYSKNYLKQNVFNSLYSPKSIHDLAACFSRSLNRISEVLSLLKTEGAVSDYRVGSKVFWIRSDQNIIILSTLKNKYLKLLEDFPLSTSMIAQKMSRSWKSSFRRLEELRNLNLVERGKDKLWRLKKSDKKILYYGNCCWS